MIDGKRLLDALQITHDEDVIEQEAIRLLVGVFQRLIEQNKANKAKVQASSKLALSAIIKTLKMDVAQLEEAVALNKGIVND